MLLSICLIAALSPLTAIYGKKHPATVIGCVARQNAAWCQKTDGRVYATSGRMENPVAGQTGMAFCRRFRAGKRHG